LFHRSAFLSGLSLPSSLELAWFDQYPATFSMQYVLVTAVPEPASLALFATGLAMLLIRRRRAASAR